ncbi:unnamed protein product, partial [Nesidiocoris tenuis]
HGKLSSTAISLNELQGFRSCNFSKSRCRRRSGETSYLHFVKTATIPMVPYVTTLNFHDISNVHVQVRNWRYEISPLRRRCAPAPSPTPRIATEGLFWCFIVREFCPAEKRAPHKTNTATVQILYSPTIHMQDVPENVYDRIQFAHRSTAHQNPTMFWAQLELLREK